MASAGQGLKGLVGQCMAGKSPPAVALVAHHDVNSGSGAYTATKGCVVIARAWGGGAAGVNNGGGGAGGGGGAAGYKVIRLSAGQTVTWSVGAGGTTSGASGGDTTITLPNGVVLTAGGGTNPAGGMPSGSWDLARVGGAGGATSGGGQPGESPLGGGTGGGGSTNCGGGGGAAGFSDLFPGTSSGNGNLGNSFAPGGFPGAGGAGLTAGVNAGGAGRMILTAVAA